MITHIPSGKQFVNRLECKLFFGHSDYNRRVHNREFTFHEGRTTTSHIGNWPFRDEVRTYTK